MSDSYQGNWGNSQFSRAALADLFRDQLALARSGVSAFVASLAAVGVIGFFDHASGYEMRLGILYLAPIAFATWTVAQSAGLLLSALAGAVWLSSFYGNHPYSHDLFYFWEGLLTVCTYVLFVALLARLKRALARSDSRLVAVLEAFDGLVLVEAQQSGEILFSNARFRKVFGAKRPRGLAQWPDRGAEELEEKASGRCFYVQSRPLQWVDGRPAVLRVLTDISEEKRGRERVRRHRDAAHETGRLMAVDGLASALAHELNQPLAAISSYSNACLRLLRSERPDTRAMVAALEKCGAQAKRAGEIIARLRGFLRQSPHIRGREDAREMLAAAAGLMQPEALEAGAKLETNLCPLPAVLADRVLIEQVVVNLLRNAIHAVQAVPIQNRRITVTAHARSGSVEAHVLDGGSGVPEEDRARLFQPFHTTKPTGLGLGLSICRSIVEAHGGSLRYAPNAEGGSCFSFTLPCAPE